MLNAYEESEILHMHYRNFIRKKLQFQVPLSPSFLNKIKHFKNQGLKYVTFS